MTASASMPPTPQPRTPSAVDHRRVRVGADERVGHARRRRGSATTRPRCSRLTWWTMPMPGGTTRKRRTRPAPSAAARSARRCARTRARCCARRRSSVPNASTCTEWSITRSAGTSGSTPRRVAARARHRGAHRGEVDDGGHAGEVLEHHARRQERHALAGAGRLGPVREREHVLLAHVQSAGVAQQPLEQDPHRVRQPLRVGGAGLVEPVDAEDVGHARQARAGTKQVVSHQLDSIAAHRSRGWVAK